MGEKSKHLEMIQNVINRMANNSFLLKGWSVLLVSALFALSAGDANIYFIYVAYFPAIAFWVLDGYFLYQERLFRELYDRVRKLENSNVDYSMDTSSVRGDVKPMSKAVFSKTLNIFHGTILVTIIVVTLIVVVRK